MRLAVVATELGRVRLHHTGRGYETRRYYRNLMTGARQDCRIPEPLWAAQWWWDLAEARGVTFGGRPA